MSDTSLSPLQILARSFKTAYLTGMSISFDPNDCRELARLCENFERMKKDKEKVEKTLIDLQKQMRRHTRRMNIIVGTYVVLATVMVFV